MPGFKIPVIADMQAFGREQAAFSADTIRYLRHYSNAASLPCKGQGLRLVPA